MGTYLTWKLTCSGSWPGWEADCPGLGQEADLASQARAVDGALGHLGRVVLEAWFLLEIVLETAATRRPSKLEASALPSQFYTSRLLHCSKLSLEVSVGG